MEPNKFSSEHIENRLLTLTSKTSSYEQILETKLQAKFDKFYQIFEQIQEGLVDFMEQQHQESKKVEESLVTINPETPCLS